MGLNVMHEVLAQSQAGQLTFSEVVRSLLDAGVESYFCDLASGQETFYPRDGKTHVEKMTLPPGPIADELTQPNWPRLFAERRRTPSAFRNS